MTDQLIEEIARVLAAALCTGSPWDDDIPEEYHAEGIVAARAILPIIEDDRAAVRDQVVREVKKYWYRQGKDDAWEAVVDRIATWLEMYQFGEFELDEASITIAGFIRAGEWMK